LTSTADFSIQEGKENKIDLPDDDPQAVDAMIAFFYTHAYGDHGNPQSDAEPMALDACVFTLADKYFVKPLKDTAAKQFTDRAKKEWSSPAFANAITEVYTSCPANNNGRALRDAILNVVNKNYHVLYGDVEKYPDFHQAVDEVDGFAADITHTLATKKLVKRTAKDSECRRYKCPNCKSIFLIESLPDAANGGFDCPRRCYGTFQNRNWWSSNLHESEEE
jgi:hypothetical protein